MFFRHLYVVQIETWCYNQDEERISIFKSWRQKGILPREINQAAM